jgi:hypothetical protein
MNFPPGVHFYEDNQLIVWRLRGLLDEKAVSDVVALLGRLEAEFREPFDRFLDSIGVDQVELNYEYMIRVALYRRLAYAQRPPIKSAILAIDSQLLHYAQLHAVLTRGSSIHVRIFQNDRGAVAQWLGVPIGLVAAEPEAESDNRQMTGA